MGKSDDSYSNNDYWDSASATWRNENPWANRIAKMSWGEQLRYGSRPVVNVSWFEARAFARWLNRQLRPLLSKRGLHKRYEVKLPTELQWERAARATTLTAADGRRWPWVGDDRDIDQRANVNELVGSASAVGLYPPNPIGLHDMAGNVWEWTDSPGGFVADTGTRLLRDEERGDSRCLRGGNWVGLAAHAACCFRYWYRTEGSYVSIGFRVVLSLAENET